MYDISTAKSHLCTVEKQTSGSFLAYQKNAGFFGNIFRKYKKFIQVSKKDPCTREYFKSTTGFLNERKRHAESGYSYIIHPFSDFAFCRELILVITYFINFYTAPLITCFLSHGILNSRIIFFLEILTSITYIFDIILKCFVGIVIKEDKKIDFVHKHILKKYLLSPFFPIDLLTSFSFFPLNGLIDLKKHFYLTYFRLFNLIRINIFLNHWTHINQRFNILPSAVEIIRYCILNAILVHWFSCFMFYVPHLSNDPHYLKKLHERENKASILGNYFHSLFKTSGLGICARTNVNKGSPFAEVAFTIFTLIFGKIYILVLTVAAVDQVLNKWSLETKYLGFMNQLVEFMRYKKLPLALRQRMEQYFDYKFQNKYFKENLITSIISDKLKREINIHVCKRLVQQAPFLSDLPTKVLGDVLIHLKSEVFLPNDTIIRAGALGDCMYFLSSGTVLVTTPSGKEVCHLSDGSFFGEIALISKDSKRTANVIALEICETYRLDKKVFKSTLKKNQTCWKALQSVAEMRHQETNALEEMYKEELFHKTYIGEVTDETSSVNSVTRGSSSI